MEVRIYMVEKDVIRDQEPAASVDFIRKSSPGPNKQTENSKIKIVNHKGSNSTNRIVISHGSDKMEG